jgi:hypothetical protein
MKRQDLEDWFAHHPGSIQTQPEVLLDRCESEVRDHAAYDAWLQAREVAEHSLHRFERIFGLPASDTFVTREVCHEIARELRHHEPHPSEEQATAWAGHTVFDSVDEAARVRLRVWLSELAEQEEHAVWRNIVHFADHLAKTLIRNQHMTSQLDWDLDHSYPKVAARVARMMIREFEAQAVSSQIRPSLFGKH